MSEKGGKKKAHKNKKKQNNAKRHSTLRLNDETAVNANVVYENNTKFLKISGVDTTKIKVSDEKFYSNIYDSYKRDVLYEHDKKHIPLNILLSDVTGRDHSFDDDNKSINFILNDEQLEKIL